MQKIGIILFFVSLNVQASISDIITLKANKYGVPERLVHSIIKQESGYNTKAVSKAGAGGIMQLMPDTARRFDVSNRFDPDQNIDGGVRYLKFLLGLFNGNVTLVVAAYNAGEGAVQKYKGVPPYHETKDYVKKVLGFYQGGRVHDVIVAKNDWIYSGADGDWHGKGSWKSGSW